MTTKLKTVVEVTVHGHGGERERPEVTADTYLQAGVKKYGCTRKAKQTKSNKHVTRDNDFTITPCHSSGETSVVLHVIL